MHRHEIELLGYSPLFHTHTRVTDLKKTLGGLISYSCIPVRCSLESEVGQETDTVDKLLLKTHSLQWLLSPVLFLQIASPVSLC